MEDKSKMYPNLPQQADPMIGAPVAPPTYNQTYPEPNTQNNIPLQSNVHTIQPTVVMAAGLPPLGPQPANITCPSCGQQGLSELRHENATKTHLMALLLCVFGLCCCAPIPYCVDSCRNANHYCHFCQQYLGTHNNNSC